MSKVIAVTSDDITFDDGHVIYSQHYQDCCESHYLSFNDLSVEDFGNLEFDLSDDDFFERVEDYGIRLIAVNGSAIPVPGYASNNGYYSSNLSLVLQYANGNRKTFDIQECQASL